MKQQEKARQIMYLYCRIEARWFNHCCNGKAKSIIYSECAFVALVIQPAMHMRHTVICACPAVQKFYTLSQKGHDFRNKKLLNVKCVFLSSLQFLSKTYLILRGNERM
jgi:hypothetical protein